ncbi:hypothetical protein ACFE04_019017 [Oxalis oulophora]
MAVSMSISVSSQKNSLLYSSFLPATTFRDVGNGTKNCLTFKKHMNFSLSITCASPKIVRCPPLDKIVVKQNKIRFVQKLKTLLLSKPKHFMRLNILSKCRSYLSLTTPCTTLAMIHRYPTVFELFTIPLPPVPLNATKPGYQFCVRLTPAAAALAKQELDLRLAMSDKFAEKLQKLLMLSSHKRLLLSKLVHLAPDLGLPPNFRSRLCNDHPDKFKTVDTSYGRALELVTWNPSLATPLPSPGNKRGLIVDRPLKFKHVKLRRGLNVKRRHEEFLIKFGELPDFCPYNTSVEELGKESLEAEKRACAVVREVLGMMVEKRILIDHLTHFRKEFGMPNKLRLMILRHPELFYVSINGLRDSVFLVESYDDDGNLLEKDESLVINDSWMKLVREGKMMRREKRKLKNFRSNTNGQVDHSTTDDNEEDDYDDGFEDLFENDDSGLEYLFQDDMEEVNGNEHNGEFWRADVSTVEGRVSAEPW